MKNDNIGYLLNHLAFVLSRQSDQILLERLGLGYSQFKIMMVLRWDPSILQKQISAKLGQTEASISRQIKILHEQGLLQSKVSPQNKREHITTLTVKGERMIDEAMSILNDYHSPVFAKLSPKDQEKMVELLKKMHEEACSVERADSYQHANNDL